VNKSALKAAIEAAKNWPEDIRCDFNWFVDVSIPDDFDEDLPLPPDSPPG
jgi:hypothetical protein